MLRKITILAIALLTAVPALAHHPFGATYVQEKMVQVEGKLVEFDYRNPHSFIQLEAQDENGKTVRWSAVWAAAAQLGTQGVTVRTLKYGDVVTITGNPGRQSDDHRIRLVSIQRKRGDFSWGAKR